MHDDAQGCLAGVIIAITAVVFLLYLAAGVAGLILVLGIAVGVGIAMNLLVRWIANQFDWRTMDESWIWLVIATVGGLPLAIALILFLAAPALARVLGGSSGEAVVILLPLYGAWMCGYLCAWAAPGFERGLGDALMSSTLVRAWAKLRMWLEYNKARRNIR